MKSARFECTCKLQRPPHVLLSRPNCCIQPSCFLNTSSFWHFKSRLAHERKVSTDDAVVQPKLRQFFAASNPKRHSCKLKHSTFFIIFLMWCHSCHPCHICLCKIPCSYWEAGFWTDAELLVLLVQTRTGLSEAYDFLCSLGTEIFNGYWVHKCYFRSAPQNTRLTFRWVDKHDRLCLMQTIT